MGGKKNKRKKVIIVLLVFLILLVLVGGGSLLYFMNQDKKVQKYEEKMQTAQKYVSDENYDAAILTCQQLIKLDETKEWAYQQLADIYIVKLDRRAALRTCSDGYRATGSSRLKVMYDSLLNEPEETEKQTAEQTEPLPDDETELPDEGLDLAEIAKNQQGRELMEQLSGYNNGMYIKNYGDITSHEETEANILRVRYKNLAADVYYSNEGSAKAYSRTTDLPLSTGVPGNVILDNVRYLFGLDNSSSIALSYEDISYILGRKPQISSTAVSGKTVLSFEWFSCKIYIECDEQGNLPQGYIWNQIRIPVQEEEETEEEKETEETEETVYYGVVVNAVDGMPVAGAEIKAISEDGTEYHAATDSDGRFEISGAGGTYSLVISKDGFITEEIAVETEEGDNSLGQFVISTVLDHSEMRVVLEWGAEPLDLDSYYVGQYDDGTSVYVYYREMEARRRGELAVGLDIDDRDGFGPETITIYGMDGNFEYTVKDYLETGTMGEVSNAVVKVYLSDGTTQTFTCPAGEGNIWNVFTVDHGEIKETGTIE